MLSGVSAGDAATKAVSSLPCQPGSQDPISDSLWLLCLPADDSQIDVVVKTRLASGFQNPMRSLVMYLARLANALQGSKNLPADAGLILDRSVHALLLSAIAMEPAHRPYLTAHAVAWDGPVFAPLDGQVVA